MISQIFASPTDTSHYLRKEDIIQLVRCIVAGLKHENNGLFLEGATVCVHDFNSILYPVFFQGIIGAGGCFTGTNPAYTADELEHHFRTSQTQIVITTTAHITRVVEAAKRCNLATSKIFVFDFEDTYNFMRHKRNSRSRPDSAHGSPSSTSIAQLVNRSSAERRFEELLHCGQADWVVLKSKKDARSTPAALFSTSGTSGLPKIAVRTHANLITECQSIQDRHTKDFKPVRLLCVPFFHAFASPLANILGIREGVPTFVMSRFAEVEFLEAVQNYRVTETALVPPIIVRWLADDSEQRRQQLGSVRTIWCGGAPLNGESQTRAVESMLRPEARIAQVWGLTECGWLSTFHYPEHDFTGSAGRALPGYRIKLVDDNDREVKEGRGELLAKSASIMKGYLSDDEATTSAFIRRGWYRTGDVGEIHEGKIYIVDRKKELIKVRGWQVAPAELEAVLLQHDRIAEAAVIGITTNPDSGEEVPQAHVVPVAGAQLSSIEVRRFLLQHLAKYKVIDCSVVFRERIPKSASGKILRKDLRAERMSEKVGD
ncbi:MAG: hypothetical protein Q9162_004433 [Coniocarpon cinnabarinum]